MIGKDWIVDKLRENDFDNRKVYKLYGDFLNDTGSNMAQSSFEVTVRRLKREIIDNENIEDISMDMKNEILVKQQANKQKLLDKNRMLNKENRETYRVTNNLEEIFSEYITLLGTTKLSGFKGKEHTDKGKKIGIMQVSDTHFNELIDSSSTLNGNYYDFYIASKRLKKYADKCIEYIKFHKIKEVYLFFTGDLVNSNKRLTEQMAQATSLTRASLLGTYLFSQMITQLNKYVNLNISHVVGNESRLDHDMDNSDLLASNNWDFLIFNNLRNMLKDKKGINFIKPKHLSSSLVTLSNGFNCLLVHGNTLKGQYQKAVKEMISLYAVKGIPINAIFTGHYHYASLGDFASQSSNLCGSNAYSDVDLKYISRASQNFYIVNEDLGYDGIKIDLQEVDNYEGYDIIDELEYYNVRSTKETVSIISKNLV